MTNFPNIRMKICEYSPVVFTLSWRGPDLKYPEIKDNKPEVEFMYLKPKISLSEIE